MDEAAYQKWQEKKEARKLQKATGAKYTAALRYIQDQHNLGQHRHRFAVYGEPFTDEDRIYFHLRCAVCGGNTFVFSFRNRERFEEI